MASLQMPDLDNLYREAGLRNSLTKDTQGYKADFGTSFYSFGDFKREVRALLIVPIICTVESLKKAAQAVSDLLIAAVQLATLDGRGFDNLGHFFVNAAHAFQLAVTGVLHTVGSVFSLYTRSVCTLVDTVGMLFQNEATEQEIPASVVRIQPKQHASNDVFEMPSFVATSAARASDTGMFARRAPTTKRQQALEQLDKLGLQVHERDAMAAEIASNPDYDGQADYSQHYRM